MARMIVGTYATRADAERVRDDLVGAGIAPARIRIHGGDRGDVTQPLPEDRGVSGFIRRMFSGMTGDSESIRKYEAHAAGGGAVLIVEASAADDSARVRDAMASTATGAVGVHDATNAPTATEGATHTPDADRAMSTLAPMEGSALPNASSGWDTSRRGAPSTIGGIDQDPARPQGDLRDACGHAGEAGNAGNPR